MERIESNLFEKNSCHIASVILEAVAVLKRGARASKTTAILHVEVEVRDWRPRWRHSRCSLKKMTRAIERRWTEKNHTYLSRKLQYKRDQTLTLNVQHALTWRCTRVSSLKNPSDNTRRLTLTWNVQLALTCTRVCSLNNPSDNICVSH